jgi:hypothetical protein
MIYDDKLQGLGSTSQGLHGPLTLGLQFASAPAEQTCDLILLIKVIAPMCVHALTRLSQATLSSRREA